MKQRIALDEDARNELKRSGVQSRGKAVDPVAQRELIKLRQEKAELKHEITVLRVRGLV